jgi:hypothetical protein
MVDNAVGDEAFVKAEAAKRWPKASLYKGFVTDHDRYRGQWGVQSPATRRLQLVAIKDQTSELMTLQWHARRE